MGKFLFGLLLSIHKQEKIIIPILNFHEWKLIIVIVLYFIVSLHKHLKKSISSAKNGL